MTTAARLPAFMPTSDYGFRVKLCRQTLELNQTEFARKLRITQGTVSDWETEKTFPGRGMLRLIADLFSHSDKVFHWLETGRDPISLAAK